MFVTAQASCSISFLQVEDVSLLHKSLVCCFSWVANNFWINFVHIWVFTTLSLSLGFCKHFTVDVISCRPKLCLSRSCFWKFFVFYDFEFRTLTLCSCFIILIVGALAKSLFESTSSPRDAIKQQLALLHCSVIISIALFAIFTLFSRNAILNEFH